MSKESHVEGARSVGKGPLSLSVVLPAYNEELSIAGAIHNISSVLEDAVEDYEIIVVNDGSRDSTLTVARAVAAELPCVVVEDLKRNSGFGGAVKAGLTRASKNVVTYFPADCPITRMDVEIYMHLSAYYDIVIGYRRQRRLDMPWSRRIISEVFHMMVNFMFKLNFYDVNWIHFYKRHHVADYLGDSNGVFFLAENLVRARAKGYSICGVDVPFVDRQKGEASGVKPRTILITVIDAFKFFWKFRLRGKEKIRTA